MNCDGCPIYEDGLKYYKLGGKMRRMFFGITSKNFITAYGASHPTNQKGKDKGIELHPKYGVEKRDE